MRFLRHVVSLGALVAASLATLAFVREASACGGCFHPTPVPGSTQSPTVVTDHRMVVALSGDTTTLWDQIRYVGDPGDFAWILPVHGGVAVGVGSNAFVDALDAQTALVVHSPAVACQRPSSFTGGGGLGDGSCGGCSSSSSGGTSANAFDDAVDGGNEGVTVRAQETVGPYDVVEIDGTDATSIVDWLGAHSYVIPPEIKPILDQYVSEGFDFVAVRLSPGSGVQQMAPIRVSWKGKDVSLPLRMVAAGVGDKVGLTLFVVGDGRWTISNFPTFVVDPSLLTWDFATARSDYTTQRATIEETHAYTAFELESSIDVRARSLPYDVSPQSDAGASDAGPTDSGAPDVPATESDVVVAFGSDEARRVTRLRGDIAASALSKDIVLQADLDPSVRPVDLRLVHFVHGASVCPGGDLVFPGAPLPVSDAALGSLLRLDSARCSTSGGPSPTTRAFVVALGAIGCAFLRRLTKR